MTLKQSLTKIGLASLTTIYAMGCGELDHKTGHYAGFPASSRYIRSSEHYSKNFFQIGLLDTINCVIVEGKLDGDERKMSEIIVIDEIEVDGKKGTKIKPWQNLPILSYAHPESLLSVHRELRKNDPIVQGEYRGYQIVSRQEGGHYRIDVEDKADNARIYGIFYETGPRFTEIGGGCRDTLGIPPSHPLSKYLNPDSLLVIHKTLRRR